MMDGAVKGGFPIVYFTPESLCMLCSLIYEERLCTIVFDEAHHVDTW